MDGVPNSGLESSSGAEGGAQPGPANMELPGQGMPQFGSGALAYPPSQYVHPQAAAQQEQLRQFWQNQMQEIHQVGTDPAEFKNHQLPLARIKKIMKSDEDVRMISAEAPVLFARACEMFILELTLRSWNHSEENKRRTLQRNDIAAAITRTDIFDFLVDIVPRDERGEDPVPMGGARPTQGPPPATSPVGNPTPPMSGGMPTGMWQQGGQGQGASSSEQGMNMMGVGQPQPQGGQPQGGQPGQGQMDQVMMLSNLYGMQHQFQPRQGQPPGNQQPSDGQQVQGVPSYSNNQQQQAKQE